MIPFIGIPTGLAAVMALVLTMVVLAQRRAALALRKLATTEPLTGLVNRREFHRVLQTEIARTSRTGRPFAIVLVDVDRLKLINDSCGHRAGDRAILRVANALRVSRRAPDTAGRLGGDEFAVILPESHEGTALRFLRRVRDVVASHRRAGIVTVSGGVAEHPRDGATAEALLEAADRALYAEKQRRSRSTPASIPRVKRDGVRSEV
jgi:diguanylate cyclase